jgi:hypothetical protein
MDLNEYATAALIRQRHAEMVAVAHSEALAREARAARRPLRVTVGTTLIRAGAWLLRREYAAREAM